MRLRIAATVAATTLVSLTAFAPGTQASTVDKRPPLQISRVQYDSPGSDTGSNPSLNAEWVRITNFGPRTRVLTGWTIRDPQGHVYRFPAFRLGSHRGVTVHTGAGRNTASNLYWRQGNYVWNNTGDRAIFRNRGGATIDVCSWGDGPGSIAC